METIESASWAETPLQFISRHQPGGLAALAVDESECVVVMDTLWFRYPLVAQWKWLRPIADMSKSIWVLMGEKTVIQMKIHNMLCAYGRRKVGWWHTTYKLVTGEKGTRADSLPDDILFPVVLIQI
ncbi:hypothetical protein TNCV_4670211 [Trichonephila clavipes]|nr:hypothetical protein TNCV_4670211 [Trichonephila clavipes]